MKIASGLLAGKTALITGASSGIGAAAARVFCREGASVVLVARRKDKLAALTDALRADGYPAHYTIADITQPEEAAHAVDMALEHFGSLNVAFNNAGTSVPPAPLHTLDDASYDHVMNTNARGVWNC
ncbi:SDR family NAD(P)-dependent oxidoreductase, partial [Streptomyces beijiangensis]